MASRGDSRRADIVAARDVGQRLVAPIAPPDRFALLMNVNLQGRPIFTPRALARSRRFLQKRQIAEAVVKAVEDLPDASHTGRQTFCRTKCHRAGRARGPYFAERRTIAV